MDNFLTEDRTYVPDIKISAKQVFGIKSDIRVPAFSKISSFVPKIDKNYYFDNDTTLAILTGFAKNKKVFRVGMDEHPIPSSGLLEKKVLPSVKSILKIIK